VGVARYIVLGQRWIIATDELCLPVFHGTTVIFDESICGNSMIFAIPTTSHICDSLNLTVAGAILRVLSGLSINDWETNLDTRPRNLLSVHSMGATVANDFLVSWVDCGSLLQHLSLVYPCSNGTKPLMPCIERRSVFLDKASRPVS
jgi:hypothetical protein